MTWNVGNSYTDEEIESLVLEHYSLVLDEERPRGLEHRERLAAQFGRSAGGIDMVFRWIEEADFPARARNRIQRQVAAAKARLRAEDLIPDDDWWAAGPPIY